MEDYFLNIEAGNTGPAHRDKNSTMPTFLTTCKMEIMRLGIASIIRNLFPDAVLLHATSRRECLRILANEEISLMISDGTIDKGPNLGLIPKIHALQPDTKILMLLESPNRDHLNSISNAGSTNRCIRKSAPVERIREAILQVLSGMEA